MNDRLTSQWATLLPEAGWLGEELLQRWQEPHRRYHGILHLEHALWALGELGGHASTERLAIWFHDAIYRGQPGTDELASARLAAERLTQAGLDAAQAFEVARLVRVTIDHSPGPDDLAGTRVSDADLAILGATPQRYRWSVDELRAETGLTGPEWAAVRSLRVRALLATPLFHTPIARASWLGQAKLNLIAELAELGDAPQSSKGAGSPAP